MPGHLTLIRKHPLAGNAWAFVFEPDQPLSWIAGQFIRVELPHPTPDAEGTRRHFTITSAPHEGFVQISTRLTDSSFKQALQRLPLGGQLSLLDLPAGDFIWPRQSISTPVILAAQGIGVTPFISMLRSRAHHQQPLTATMLYANRHADIPFRDELTQWAGQHPEFKLIFSSDRLNAATMREHFTDLSRHQVYVAGPHSLISLLGPPFNLPAASLKHDLFPNYAASLY